MAKTRNRRCLVEDFSPIRLDDLRRAAGGRKRLNRVNRCQVSIPSGADLEVNLVHRAANLGGEMVMMCCPSCGNACRVLRVVAEGLVCLHCLRAMYSVKYLSQLRPPAAAMVQPQSPSP